jgi:hypothetical protein
MIAIFFLAGRLLFGALFLYNGVNHFIGATLMLLSLPRPWPYSCS